MLLCLFLFHHSLFSYKIQTNVLILLRIKSNCVFLKLYISYLHWLALKFVSIFCISVILSTLNHDFVPKESVSVSTQVRFGTQKVRFGIHESPFRSVPVRSDPSRSVSVSTKVRFGIQKVRFGIHESPFRSVPVRLGKFRYPLKSVSVPRKSVSVSMKVRFGPFRSVSVSFGIH